MILHATDLHVRFGTLHALRGVSLRLAAGEVVGIAGRSGSGKSVLMQVLAGLMVPTSGTLAINGRAVRWPFIPRHYGIGHIPQHPLLVDRFDVTENIYLGVELRRPLWAGPFALPDRALMDERAREILARLDADLPSLRERGSGLSGEGRRIVAIARLLAAPCPIILADDPAADLSARRQQRLLEQIETWQREGRALLIASSSLDQLFAVADRILVLREGQLAADLRADETSREEVVAAMVGTADYRQLTPIMWALDNYARARADADRLRQSQSLRERDHGLVDSLGRELIEQLAEQVSALDSANLALQDSQRRLLMEREHERKALARELHDQVIQDLLGINYELEAIAEQDGQPGRQALGALRDEIRGLVDGVRRICGDLRPPTLDSLGLIAAVRSLARDWSRRSGVQVSLDLDERLGRLPEPIELSIFRIVQESLSNVRKYADASHVIITLQPTSPRALLISIADDGRGIPGDLDLASLAAEGHYGLLGISERVALIQGRLSLGRSPEGGMLLQAEIPHPRAAPSE